MATRANNQKNLAFVFFNKFLDICEAIDDPDNSSLDNADLDNTIIPPLEDVLLPEAACLSEEKREQIRDYVLEYIATEPKERQCLPQDDRLCGGIRANKNLVKP